jgi:putative DNA primase/helicase
MAEQINTPSLLHTPMLTKDSRKPPQTTGTAFSDFYLEDEQKAADGKQLSAPRRDSKLSGDDHEHNSTKEESLDLFEDDLVRDPTNDLSDGRAISSPKNGMQGGRKGIPYASFTENYVSAELSDDHGSLHLLSHKGIWYRYTASHWQEYSVASLKSEVAAQLHRTEYADKTTSTAVNNIIINLQASDICGLLDHQAMPRWLDEDRCAKDWMQFNGKHIVNVARYADAINAGGTAPDDIIREASPEFFSNDYVLYDWDPGAACPEWMKFLNYAVPSEENRGLLQEMMGFSLLDSTRYQVFMILVGKSGTGKSTTLEVLRSLIGQHNVSGVRLENLNKRFQTRPLGVCKINIQGDMPDHLGAQAYGDVEGDFKDIVSGGDVSMEVKMNPVISTSPCRARFWFGANELPHFRDSSGAIDRRMRVIQMDRKPMLPDPHLLDRLKMERPGILQWALHGLARVTKNGQVVDPDTCKKIKTKHQLESNHAARFLKEEYYKAEPDDHELAATVYGKYRDYVLEQGYRPVGEGKFAEEALRMYGSEKKRIRIEGRQTRVFMGIRAASFIAAPGEADLNGE